MHSPIKVNLKTAEGKPTSTTINFVLAYGLLIAQNKGKIGTLDITRELVAKNLQAFIADLNKQIDGYRRMEVELSTEIDLLREGIIH